MAIPDLLANISRARADVVVWLSVAVGTSFFYSLLRGIYNLYFDPLSKYPGPKLAAVSNIWYAYNWLTGKWPWKIEGVLRRYGDIVRIAPNELVFLTPQAGKDIHATHVKNLEIFIKTDFEDLGEDGGISFEIDPAKHHEVAKRLSPVFNNKNIKTKEKVLHTYIDFFVNEMKMIGGEKSVKLCSWADWLIMDISADMIYNRQMNQMKNDK